MHHLETINKVSQQIMLSLDTEKTISLLDGTIQETLEADTYFIGLLQDNEIHMELFYDDGEYFNGAKIPLDGTLSGWVIKNQKELFLPDLREQVELEGTGILIIGKEKTSLSWMGVPLTAPNIKGVISLGSYQPNAFDGADMELLSSLAQHITLALDNTIRHAQVEEQARLDGLTSVYNHGYFLKKLVEQAIAFSKHFVRPSATHQAIRCGGALGWRGIYYFPAGRRWSPGHAGRATDWADHGGTEDRRPG